MLLSTWCMRTAHKLRDIGTKLVTCASMHVSTYAWQMQVANFVLMSDHGGNIIHHAACHWLQLKGTCAPPTLPLQ